MQITNVGGVATGCFILLLPFIVILILMALERRGKA